jgi:hypothetical protein
MFKLVEHAKRIKEQDHEDITYLMRDDISSVLSIALGELYLSQPKNQLHFLGNWLINYSISQKNQAEEFQKIELKDNLKTKYEKSLKGQLETEAKLQSEIDHQEKLEQALKSEISSSLDIEDFLTTLINHIKDRTNAAAGYIGILERIKKPVTPLDDEKAHIDEDSPLVVRYVTATPNNKFIINKILKEEEGQATWSIWKEDEEDVQDPEEPLDEGKKNKIKFISVEDVVNDPRIKFFDVPRLGSYFAVPLSYNSCLFESSFDAAVEDAIECRKLRAQQEEERTRYKAGNREDGEVKEFTQIKEAPYKTIEFRYVVALDTIGQDRTFTQQQKDYIVEWVKFFKTQWERAEIESLKRDVSNYLPARDKDQQRLHDKLVEWTEDQKNVYEDAIKSLHNSLSDDIKQLEGHTALFVYLKSKLLLELDSLFKFADYKVVKFSKVFQIAFYLSGVQREDIVEPGTNLIQWKKAKKYLNVDFKNFLEAVQMRGPKPEKPAVYAMTLKLEKDLVKIQLEDLQNYSISLWFLYKFLEQAFKLRVLDVNYRRKEYVHKTELREIAIKAAEELEERKRKHLEDAKEAYLKEIETMGDVAEKPQFDHDRVMAEFDAVEGNKPVEIPLQLTPDLDGDIDWDENPVS